jgi:hypothetical protein
MREMRAVAQPPDSSLARNGGQAQLFPLTVRLTCEEQVTLDAMIHPGKANARTVTRARILLKSADGWSTAAIVEALDVCQATVTNVRRRFAQGGLGAVLHDKVQQHRESRALWIADGPSDRRRL